MRKQNTYTGRKKIKLTPFDYFLIVLFLLIAIPAAIKGGLKDGPQLEALPAASDVSDVAETDIDRKVDAMLRELSAGDEGADMQRADQLLYIAPSLAPGKVEEAS